MAMLIPPGYKRIADDMRRLWWSISERWIEDGEETRESVDHLRAWMSEWVGSPNPMDGVQQADRIRMMHDWLIDLYARTPRPWRALPPNQIPARRSTMNAVREAKGHGSGRNNGRT